MFEIVNIFYIFFTFVILFSFPFNKFTTNQIIKIRNLNFFDYQCLNLIFFCYVMLILSFLNLNLKLIYYIYLLLSLLFVLLQNLKNLNFTKINSKESYFFFFLITISIFFYIAHNIRLEWDGHHWLEKVVFFYNENKIENYFKLKGHPEYPHLGTYIWALFWKNSFVNYEYVGRLFVIYLFTVSVFSLVNNLNTKLENIKTLLILFIILIGFEPFLLGGYQEYYLFSILIISSRLIFLLDFKNLNHNLLILIILSFGLLLWFKDEGIFYFLMFSILLILNIKTFIKIKLFYCILIFSILLSSVFAQKILMGNYALPSGASNATFIEIRNLFQNPELIISKCLKIFEHLLIAFLKYLSWILILFSSICILFTKKFNDQSKYLFHCFILNFLFLFCSFMTFSMVSIDFVLRNALDRLLFQTSGLYIILFIYLLNDLRIFKNRI